MDIIIDTCSWLKIQYLDQIKVINLRPLIYSSNIWMTHELHKEFIYHLGAYLDYSKFSIKKIEFNSLKKIIESDLDDADLSMISFCRENPNLIAISDDGPALQLLNMFNATSFQLSEFLFYLTKNEILTKNLAIKSIKKLREWKNIKEKKKDLLIFKINHD